MKKILTLLLAVLLALSLLTACGASTDQAAPMESYSYTAGNSSALYDKYAEEPMAAPEVEEEEYTLNTSISTTGQEDGMTEPAEPQSNYAEKIIYTGFISMQTTEFDEAVAKLEQSVKDFGGFVQDSGVQGHARTMSDGTTVIQDRWAHYVVRIPTDKFDLFMTSADGIGNVTNSSRSAQNVTSQYTDYEARLTSLTIQEERLLDMLKQSGDLDSLITLEARLSEVRYEIESIERNLRNLDQRLAYSTIELDVSEVEKYTPYVPVTRTFGEKLADAFSDGWTGFMDGVEDFVLFLAESLLTLIFLAAVVVVIVMLIRRRRRIRKAKKSVTPPPTEA